MNLRLLGIAHAHDRLLDQPRCIFADVEAAPGGNHDHYASGLTELERRLGVLVDEDFLDCSRLGSLLRDDQLELTSEMGQPLGQSCGAVGPKLTVGDMAQAIAVGLDQSPAGRAEARIQTKDPQASFSSSSSGIFSLPQTVWTSSSSSSASIRLASF
jgi:hypothetical protein